MMWIWSALFLTSSYCTSQPADLVSDIYYNAPPIIRAALVNVGLNPRNDFSETNIGNQIKPPPSRLSSPLTPHYMFKNDQRRRSTVPDHLLIPVGSTVKFGHTTRVPLSRRQYFPRPISQPPTASPHHRRRTHSFQQRNSVNRPYSPNGWLPGRTGTPELLTSQSQITSLVSIRRSSNTEKFAKLVRNINCKKNKEWCDLNDDYPQSDMEKIIEPCSHLTDKMYAPIPFAVPELDVKRRDENATTFAHLRRSGQDYWRGSLCHTERRYARPSYARNTTGHWNVIIQTAKYPQRVPLEICRNEGGKCDKMANCGGDYKCVQKYNYQMLVSIDPKKPDSCPSICLYQFPSSCVCTVDRRSPAL